ncbi:hypothetical protein PLICRDRAFT_170459 [Plicaturopsis crispa FD-325 SS-3]|nr:hypothetical protein PLICRDRAFT_170459 [Plicaturopsis crispa FD-325 SS-3]
MQSARPSTPPRTPGTPRRIQRTPPRQQTAPSAAPSTPRRHKAPPAPNRSRGLVTLPAHLSTYEKVEQKLVSSLKLSFLPDKWQVELIMRVLQGYDCIFCAGTGYGKSLVFQGLAALRADKKKLVMVISPLKALERDQVEEAKKKGLKATMINEDTSGTASVWRDVRTDAQLVYLSPEMARSDSFTKLWKDPKFEPIQ